MYKISIAGGSSAELINQPTMRRRQCRHATVQNPAAVPAGSKLC